MSFCTSRYRVSTWFCCNKCHIHGRLCLLSCNTCCRPRLRHSWDLVASTLAKRVCLTETVHCHVLCANTTACPAVTSPGHMSVALRVSFSSLESSHLLLQPFSYMRQSFSFVRICLNIAWHMIFCMSYHKNKTQTNRAMVLYSVIYTI